jgi:hypothetical protein
MRLPSVKCNIFHEILDTAPQLRQTAVKRLVYLLAESENVLNRGSSRFISLAINHILTRFVVDPDTVYIIGGIVDHNRHKVTYIVLLASRIISQGVALARATELNMESARLPLDFYMEVY